MATTAVKKVLNPKTPEGQLLAGLATAQRFKGLRLFFMRVTKVLMRGKVRKISDIGQSTEIEDTVKKFNKVEAAAYTTTLVKIGFPQLSTHRGKVMGFLSETAQAAKQVVSKIGQTPVHRRITSNKIATALEQHIDFLKDESFFQKAHKAAKRENLITRNKRTREFYHDMQLNMV